MWREFVENFSIKCAFALAASDQSLKDAEVALGIALPPELRSLLLESNGIGEQVWRWHPVHRPDDQTQLRKARERRTGRPLYAV